MNSFDLAIFNFMGSIRSDGFTELVIGYTNFGYPKPLTTIVAVIVIYLWLRKKRPQAFLLAVTMVVEATLNSVLKLIFKRERPMFFGGEEAGLSFPSGHAMAAITFSLIIAYLLYINLNRNKIASKVSTWLIIIAGILMGVSRIYLGVHYATDVIGGWVFGGLLAGFAIWVFHKKYGGKV